MTSVPQQSQDSNQSSDSTSAATSVPSYASATKKAVSSPPIATGSSTQSSTLAVSGSEPVQQNGKSSNTPPVNGRASITPAIPSFTPAIAHSNADHGRKTSVNLPANGGPVGGQKAAIPQFGSLTDSPAASHSTPQIAQSTIPASMNTSGNPRVTSPAHSPSPIPIPAASGGRPPSGMSSNGIAFGSLGGDGDRHMRQASGTHSQLHPGGQQSQGRRESSGEMGHQGPNSSRGGYQGGRGRGGSYNNGGSGYQQPQMGFNPAQAQFRPQNQGRGGMPPQFQPGRPYPNSPHQATRSPALQYATPGTPGTPNMGQPMSMQSPQQYGAYPQHNYMGASQAVYSPSISNRLFHQGRYEDRGTDFRHANNTRAGGKGKKSRGSQQNQQQRGSDRRRFDSSHGQSDGTREILSHNFMPANASTHLVRSERGHFADNDHAFLQQPHSLSYVLSQEVPKLDLSPGTGQFEQYLTDRQNFQQGYPYDSRMGGMPGMQGGPYAQMQYQQMQYMQPGSPQPGYQQPYIAGQYSQQGPQPMSRTNSQMSERPNSSLGQPQTPSQAPSSVHSSQTPKPAPASTTFQRPKSKAILIKRPDGGDLDLSALKAPASPAASIRSRTPPVASTPTPPPKASTPLHQRTDSAAASGKSQEQRIAEFKEQMEKAARGDKDKADAAKPTETPAVSEPAKEEAEPSVEPKEDIVKVVDVKDEALDAEAEAKKKQEEEDAELERQIAEMEAADAAREKAEEERMLKRKAEKAIKDKEEAEKKKLTDEENDRRLREQEREMERIEDEREAKRKAAEAGEASEKPLSVAEALAGKKAEDKDDESGALTSKLSALTIEGESNDAPSDSSMGPPKVPAEKRGKPSALNLAPLNTKPVEPPQPSAALQSLKSARFLSVINDSLYPEGIKSPAPGVNQAVATKGKSFKYDTAFLLQFQKVFTEKPSMEFESQIKNLIGDSEPGSARAGSARGGGSMGPRSTSNRNAPGAFVMGNFGAANGGKTLPPGTSSAERFAMSQGTLPRPGASAMASFSRPGSTPFGSNPMTRVPSSSGMAGNLGPNSPRNASTRGGRNNSKRDFKDKQSEAQAAKTMPLTAGMDLKPIEVSASGWKPRSVMSQASATGAAGPAPGASAGGHMDPDMVQRKVKAALNKMTPEKFDKIADQILVIAGQSKDEADGRTLRQVIQLTFEKATDEAHWASMYAKFCKRMLETMSPEIRDESILDKNQNVVSGGNLFRKYLLNRCQEEFERGWQVNLPEKPEGEEGDNEKKSDEAVMLSDEYYIAAAAKRRGLGLVQFIGELYKLGMLTERIMHECVKKLVDYTGIPDEAEVESLTKLLKTIGANLDSTEKGHPMMDVYFQRITAMMETPGLPSRLHFMLLDIVDLRKKNWQSKETNKGPKTLDEIRAEAEAAAAIKAAESARGSQRGGGGARMQSGRGDARNFSNQYGNQPPPDYNRNQVASDDLRRLGKSTSTRNSGLGPSLGPTSLFSSRSNSGRKLGPGGAFGRGGEDSGASSRTGTPPQVREKEPTATANAFAALQQLEDMETPASPPSVKATPAEADAEIESGPKEGDS